jgi:hypothetical protein
VLCGAERTKDDDTHFVATHVDDSIVTGSNDDKTDAFVREMLARFDGTCERNLTEMLGMEWERDIEAGTSTLHQRAFKEKLLKASVMHRRYRAIVGELGWLNQGTRPDISHTYSELSKFVQSPGQKHLDAVEYCLKYFAGPADLCIHYGCTKENTWKCRGY